MTRDLSPAEEQGWRRFWDGWIICPPCKAEYLERRGLTEWNVPVDYDRPIGEADPEYDTGCMKCGDKPPLLLTWKTQVA